jgi:hypothetical protein
MDEEKTIESKIDKPDLSQKTIIVLVVLTVLISALGTFAVLNEVNTVKLYAPQQTSGTTSGQAQLTILKPGDTGVSTPAIQSATGRMSLNILPPKK